MGKDEPKKPKIVRKEMTCTICGGTGKLLSGVTCATCNGTGKIGYLTSE